MRDFGIQLKTPNGAIYETICSRENLVKFGVPGVMGIVSELLDDANPTTGDYLIRVRKVNTIELPEDSE
jgi:hypothetical protein